MSTGLLVVDVQPAFHEYCGFIARKVAQRINNTRKPTTVMWVGEGLTDDDEFSVREYLRAHGARPGRLAQCLFVEKDYGFFRTYMNRVDRELIIKIGRVMLETPGCYNSNGLDLEQLEVIEELPTEPLRRPGFAARPLLGFDAFETCGGGNNECLAEMELWLEMQSKPYKRLDHLVYG